MYLKIKTVLVNERNEPLMLGGEEMTAGRTAAHGLMYGKPSDKIKGAELGLEILEAVKSGKDKFEITVEQAADIKKSVQDLLAPLPYLRFVNAIEDNQEKPKPGAKKK